jgi:hypothetical protein
MSPDFEEGVEGQLRYQYRGVMGSGWYIYQNGKWVVWDDMPPQAQWFKCECGAEKAGQPGHSSWCPKYER